MIRMSVVWLCFLACCVAKGASIDPPRVTGVFSDMAYHEESGDIVGMELFVVNSVKGYHAVVQWSDGTPGVPAVVPVELSGARIAFELPATFPARGRFSGVLSKEGIVGKFDSDIIGADGTREMTLRRKPSYWQ